MKKTDEADNEVDEDEEDGFAVVAVVFVVEVTEARDETVLRFESIVDWSLGVCHVTK